MNTIQNFEHPELGEIRVLEIDDAPWFVGKDIAAALRYSDTFGALKKHIDDEDKLVAQIDSAGQKRDTIIINENGFYSLAFSSKLPNAKQVKNWIARDVLPILREHNKPVKNDDNTSEPFANTSNETEKYAIQVFENPEFGQIRMLEEDGKVLFCAHDVATALGYKNPRDAINRHCRYVVKRDGVSFTTNQHGATSEQTVEMSFILEGDVYRLIVRSNLPSAEKFERWVFDEVLPSIRKHGLYATDERLDNPDLLISLTQKLKQEREKRKVLEAKNMIQKQAIADFQPIKQYVDVILASNQAITITQIAADYDISGVRLNKILNEEGVQ